jgi:uncharacterized protein YceH (UPF0502 family)
MLRGPQTAAELRTRSERLYPFASLPDVEAALAKLAERELVMKLPHRPGERGERWTQLLGESSAPAHDAHPAPQSPLDERITRIEQTLEALLERLDRLEG